MENDKLEKKELRREEDRQVINILLNEDQWKYIFSTNGVVQFSPTMSEVNTHSLLIRNGVKGLVSLTSRFQGY